MIMKAILMTLMFVLASLTGASAQSDFVAKFADKPGYTVIALDKQQIEEQGDSIKAGEVKLVGSFANQADSVCSIYSASPKTNAHLLKASRKEFSKKNGFEIFTSGKQEVDGETVNVTILRKSLGEKRFITVFIVEKLSSDPVEVCVGIIVGPFDITNPFGEDE